MFRSTSAFDKLLDKATSHLRLEPDWPTIIQITDQIRQGDVQPKHALASIKKKLTNPNPHVAMYALIVLESCVKNCGSLIHDEIGTKAYMEQLRELVKTSSHDNVKTKILELIQAWAFAFRNSPKYRAVQDTMNIMKAEEYKFPVLKESDAMFSADTAPEWADGDVCHRCRVQFSMVQRKHHCRACGQVFCAQCSSRTCTLPKFGIEKEVRVCEACYNKINKPTTAAKQNSTEELPVEYLTSSLAQQNQAPPPRKSEDELREEEELQLALALSQSEAEHKDKQKTGRSFTPTSRPKTYSPPPVSRDTSSPSIDDVDPELARYLNRSYWETRTTDESNPSAPSNPPPTTNVPKQSREVEQNGVASDSEMEEFVRDLKSQVEIFVNRMKSNSSRGRSIADDSSVQKLFMNITAMHSKLLHYIQQQDDSRVYYEGLQDKLVQVKDARAALDALRDEHREKLRREAEMAERQRQHQMAQKLDIMRKKKQEYLQYQRQLTLQRIQEQEREMQMRQEQQKQQYLMGSQYGSLGYIPQGGYDSLQASGYAMPPASIPPGFPHYPQGIPGMMMPPQGYIPAPPGAPPGPGSMMHPVMQQMMPPMGPMPPQMMGQMPPNSSPAHLPNSQGQIPPNTSPAHLSGSQGQTSGHQGQMPGSQGQMQGPQGQIQGPPSQMQGPLGQMHGPPGQMQGPQGQISGPPSQMVGQGQMPGPHGQIPSHQSQIPGTQAHIPTAQGQIPGSQGQISMSTSQAQIPPQGGMPNQTQNPAQSHLPNQGQGPHHMTQMPSQHQIVPGAPMSPTSNAPIQPMGAPMMPPMGPQMGQPYQQHQPQQPPPPQEQTAELISFD